MSVKVTVKKIVRYATFTTMIIPPLTFLIGIGIVGATFKTLLKVTKP